MNKAQAAEKLADTVKRFTSLADFTSSSTHSYNDHMEYRAGLYRAMCEALTEYRKAVE